MKAVAPHTIYIIIAFALFLVIAIVIFSKYVPSFRDQVTRASCAFEFRRYCTEWKVKKYTTEPFDWPKECTELDPAINKPTTKDQCEGQ